MRSRAQNKGAGLSLGKKTKRRKPTPEQAARFDAMRRAGVTQTDVYEYLTETLSVSISYPSINHVLWDRFENEDVEKAVAKLTRMSRRELFPEKDA